MSDPGTMAATKTSPRSARGGPSAEEKAARREVADTALAMSRRGLSPGRSGNVSRRWRDGMLITPSGVSYDTLSAEDIVLMGPNGGARGRLKPSSEWRFHRDRKSVV